MSVCQLLDEKIEAISNEVEAAFRGSLGSHDFDHTLRVYNMALTIGHAEGADMNIVKLAAKLHDIGRSVEDEAKGAVDHATVGAQMARELLGRYDLPSDMVDAVCHCIATHRFRGTGRPESLEAKVLYDADKLDAIGAIGLARSFVFAGEVGARVHDKDIIVEKTQAYTKEDTAYREYLVKLRYIKDSMLTETGRRLARSRHEFMQTFFERINAEVDGKA